MGPLKKEKWNPVLRWVAFSLLLLLFYALQTMPGFLRIAGVKPVLIAALAICVSMFEGVMSSALFAMAAGLLWDTASNKLFGFNGLIFLVCGLFVSLLCIYYLRTKAVNSLLFCGSLLLVQGAFDYLFYYALWGYGEEWLILVRHILPTALYTVAVTPLVFLLVRWIERKLNTAPRV